MISYETLISFLMKYSCILKLSSLCTVFFEILDWTEGALHMQMIHLSFENVYIPIYENEFRGRREKKGMWTRIEKTSLHMLCVTAHWIPCGRRFTEPKNLLFFS